MSLYLRSMPFCKVRILHVNGRTSTRAAYYRGVQSDSRIDELHVLIIIIHVHINLIPRLAILTNLLHLLFVQLPIRMDHSQ